MRKLLLLVINLAAFPLLVVPDAKAEEWIVIQDAFYVDGIHRISSTLVDIESRVKVIDPKAGEEFIGMKVKIGPTPSELGMIRSQWYWEIMDCKKKIKFTIQRHDSRYERKRKGQILVQRLPDWKRLGRNALDYDFLERQDQAFCGGKEPSTIVRGGVLLLRLNLNKISQRGIEYIEPYRGDLENSQPKATDPTSSDRQSAHEECKDARDYEGCMSFKEANQ